MGTYCSSANNNRGQTDTMNLLILLTALAGVALAEPWGYYGYPYYYHQQNWPSVSGPGFSSTIYGARGKRSAEPEAEPAYGYPAYGYYGYPAVYNVPSLQWPGVRAPGFSQTTFGLRGKRSAEADAEPHYGYYGYPYAYGGFYGYPYARYAYGPGVAAHPGGATSSTYRSPQGIGKRSAEADAEPHYGFYGYPAYAGFYGYHPYAFRPVATSFESRSPQGAKAKRSAEAEPAYGYYGYGYGFPYFHQQAWPSYSAPGVSSTVWGLRG